MRNSVGEENLMVLKESLKIQRRVFLILVIYMLARLLLNSHFDKLDNELIANIIDLFDLAAGSIFTALIYEIVKFNISYANNFEEIYNRKIKLLIENKTKLALLNEIFIPEKNKTTLLSYLNDYYNYVITNNLYDTLSRENFIVLINKCIDNIKKSKKKNLLTTKKQIIFDFYLLNDDAIKSMSFFLNEGLKLKSKYKF